jgi:hypothetical protein
MQLVTQVAIAPGTDYVAIAPGTDQLLTRPLLRAYARSLTAEALANALFANENVRLCRTVQFTIVKSDNLF